ncbi:MAG: flagellar basal body rod protein FlgB [Xanthomonadales bacterium]|nr:flagellar basal body rod protein FlgB [Xanthomonadales bacterium]
MAFSLDNIFGIHAQALEFRSRRSQLLAENLANADTPNYKARDISFQRAMEDAGSGPGKLMRTHPRHLEAPGDTATAAVQYRVPLHPSLDGNTVSPHLEKAEFAENALRYQASLLFVNRRLNGIKNAMSDQ